MTTIRLTFPWGRYYAHPWGINPTRLREAEWPPSPWRLLRALVSAWFRAHPGCAPSAECITLIEALGRELPEIGAGKVSFGQTVHWQPNYGAASTQERAGASYKKTRHENHFVAVPGPVVFHWPSVTLSPSQRRVLETLLAELTYFGRAESLCDAEVCDPEPAANGIGWCRPAGGRRISASCREVFCPGPAAFQFSDLWLRRAELETHDANNAPPHFVDALLSTNMKADGAAWFSYQMPDGWPQKWVVRTPRTAKPTGKPAPSSGPKVARYLCFSLQCRVPLLPKFIVPLAERFRDAAHHHLCKVYGDGTPSFALFGHDRPDDAAGDHQHAFYLPMPALGDDSGLLTDLHVWCPYGFTQAEVEILLRIQRLNWGSGRYPVRPVLTGLGKEAPADAPFSTGKTASRIWRSVSPFVPPRHFYRRVGRRITLKEKDRPEQQLAECLKSAGVTTAGEIRRTQQPDSNPAAKQTQWDVVRVPEIEEFTGSQAVNVTVHRNSSEGGRGKERRVGLFLEIEFDAPLALPFPALGNSCHFGLGLFVPARSGEA